MKIESQLTDLKLSQRLKKLGCPQDSVWYWKQFDSRLGDDPEGWKIQYGKDNSWLEQIAAYSCAELGVLLFGKHLPPAPEEKNKWLWHQDDFSPFAKKYTKTETNARGLMLEYLITNNLIDPKEMRL